MSSIRPRKSRVEDRRDESVDKQIVDRLRSDGHDVLFIAELDPGIDDDAVLSKSRKSNAVLVRRSLWRRP